MHVHACPRVLIHRGVLFLLATFFASLGAAAIPAEAEGGRTTTVNDLGWISGTWQGRLGEAVIEEQWSEPLDGNMIGMFRMVEGGEAGFYEFMSFETRDGVPTLHLKHFSAGLIGWEEKAEVLALPLVRSAPREVVFEGADLDSKGGGTVRLIYRRPADGELVIVLEKEKPASGEGAEPARSSTEFRFTKKP